MAQAASAVKAMALSQKVDLFDDIRLEQPHLLGAVLSLKHMGVSEEKMSFALEVLLTCFLAIKNSANPWPKISRADLDASFTRLVHTVTFTDGFSADVKAQSAEQYVVNPSEPVLLAYLHSELGPWLARVSPQDSDSHVGLCVMSIVDAIAATSPTLGR